jgi:hypothetical protein
MLVMASAISAREIERKWGLSYAGSVIAKPVLTSNPSKQSTGRGSSAFSVLGEYYLPGKWSVEAGYYRAEVSYGSGDRTMEGLQSGVRKYFVDPEFFIQPYVTTAIQVNWSDHREVGAGASEYRDIHSGVKRYEYVWDSKNPRLSLAPGVGAEFYLLSPVAFVVRYSFNIGLSSNTSVEVTPPSGQSYRMKDKGMYHNLELGIKITFPFRFTDEDSSSILNAIKQGFGLD